MGKHSVHYSAGLLAASLTLVACNMTTTSTNFGSSTAGNQSAPPLSGPGSSSPTSTPTPTPSPTSTPSPASSGTGQNVMAVTVGGTGLCGGGLNEPCASVTVCVPGTTTCQTISNILVDTGSYGLRIFSQAISLSLTQVTNGTGVPVAECAQFGTASTWGPVMIAGIQLGSEPVINVPIQVINSTYSTIPAGSGCTSPETSPTQAHFNGILGVGLFTHDCGSACTTNASVGIYYGCNAGTCTGSTLPLASQVQNPVALLPIDNNGVLVSLPSIPAGGTAVVSGNLLLGIGTQANNTPSGVTTYLANTSGNFTTNFNSGTYTASFIDSGSNALFFPPPSSLASCPSTDPYAPGWFCPSSTQSYTAANESYTGANSSSVSFQIGNASSLFSSGNGVFNDVGATSASSGFATSFDWGLPFFFGRNVYVGISGARSTVGTGPYWAY